MSCLEGPRPGDAAACTQIGTELTVSLPLPSPLPMGRYTLTLAQPAEGDRACQFYVSGDATTPAVSSGMCTLGPERTLSVAIDFTLHNCDSSFAEPPMGCDIRYTERIVIIQPPVALRLMQTSPTGSVVDFSITPGMDDCEVEGFEASD